MTKREEIGTLILDWLARSDNQPVGYLVDDILDALAELDDETIKAGYRIEDARHVVKIFRAILTHIKESRDE